MPVPTVPRPLSYIFPSATEPNLNNGDSRYGFYLPPPSPGGPGGPSNPSDPSVTMRTEAGGCRVPIDPVLLLESQLSLRPPPVVYHSLSSQSRQKSMPFPPGQGPTPPLSDQNPLTGDPSEASDSLDTDSGNDSEGNRVDDLESEGGYESDGSDSDENHPKSRVRNSAPINVQD